MFEGRKVVSQCSSRVAESRDGTPLFLGSLVYEMYNHRPLSDGCRIQRQVVESATTNGRGLVRSQSTGPLADPLCPSRKVIEAVEHRKTDAE